MYLSVLLLDFDPDVCGLAVIFMEASLIFFGTLLNLVGSELIGSKDFEAVRFAVIFYPNRFWGPFRL
jgi:hypothetical protein